MTGTNAARGAWATVVVAAMVLAGCEPPARTKVQEAVPPKEPAQPGAGPVEPCPLPSPATTQPADDAAQRFVAGSP